MKRETDDEAYWELRDRPDSWSEAKAMAGVEMDKGGRGEQNQGIEQNIISYHLSGN